MRRFHIVFPSGLFRMIRVAGCARASLVGWLAALLPLGNTLAQPSPANGVEQLDAVNVDATRYNPLAPPFPRALSFLSMPGMSFPAFTFDLGFNVMDTMV